MALTDTCTSTVVMNLLRVRLFGLGFVSIQRNNLRWR